MTWQHRTLGSPIAWGESTTSNHQQQMGTNSLLTTYLLAKYHSK